MKLHNIAINNLRRRKAKMVFLTIVPRDGLVVDGDGSAADSTGTSLARAS